MAEAPKRIEQNGLPTALLWHPLLGSDFEDRLVSHLSFAVSINWVEVKGVRGASRGVCLTGSVRRNLPSRSAMLGKACLNCAFG